MMYSAFVVDGVLELSSTTVLASDPCSGVEFELVAPTVDILSSKTKFLPLKKPFCPTANTFHDFLQDDAKIKKT